MDVIDRKEKAFQDEDIIDRLLSEIDVWLSRANNQLEMLASVQVQRYQKTYPCKQLINILEGLES